MRAGELRHQVTIQRNTATAQDNYGQVVESWSTIATRWASIRPMTGDESEEGKQVKAKATHEIKMRYLVDITTKDRVKLGTRIFNVYSIINTEEKNKETVLKCIEAV